jgi:hypothetical protein
LVRPDDGHYRFASCDSKSPLQNIFNSTYLINNDRKLYLLNSWTELKINEAEQNTTVSECLAFKWNVSFKLSLRT